MSNGSIGHLYTLPEHQPASVFHEEAARTRQSGDPLDPDPRDRNASMPPNYGQMVLPHAVEFMGIMRTISRTYYPSDEAILHSRDNARFMLNDVGIRECLEQRQRSSALLDWHVEAEEDTDPTAKALAAEMEIILKQTPDFMQFRESLLMAIWTGKAAISEAVNWVNVRGKQRLCITDWQPVHGDKIVYRFDDGSGEYFPGQVGLRIGAGYSGGHLTNRVHIERTRKVEATEWGLCYFLEHWERDLVPIHHHRREDGEYESWTNAGRIHGLGIRSVIYWEWVMMRELQAFLMEFLERSSGGLEIWQYPAGNVEAKEKTKRAAEERLGNGRNIVLVPVYPEMDNGMATTQVRVVEFNMGGAEVLKSLLIDYFGHRIKRYILGQILTSEAASTGLGSGVATIHLDQYLQIIRYDCTSLEETITKQVLQKLQRWNFPALADVPLHFKIQTESPDIEGKLRGWKEAFEMGLRIKAKDLAAMVGTSLPEPEEEALQDPRYTQAQAQQQQAAMGGGMPMSEGQPGQEVAGQDMQQPIAA